MILNHEKIVTFRLGDDLFAAGVGEVERVLRYERPRPIPNVPDWVEGVMDYQKSLLPVVDLRRRFELEPADPGPDTRVVVLNVGGTQMAIVVDSVLEVGGLDPADVAEPPAFFRGLAGEYLRGLVRRSGQIVILLDVERLLTATERLHLERAAQEAATDE
jgi:purine-binding chemotaxis protein CheW